ncbi:MAG: M48 family metallopeptidase [Treponema sp.]|nr:M48 family metallopeptidase [Treponema sp.]
MKKRSKNKSKRSLKNRQKKSFIGRFFIFFIILLLAAAVYINYREPELKESILTSSKSVKNNLLDKSGDITIKAKDKAKSAGASISGAAEKTLSEAGSIAKNAGSQIEETIDKTVDKENITSSFSDAKDAIDKVVESITPEQEYYLGRAVAANLLSKYKIYNKESLQKYLNSICHVLAVNSDKHQCYVDYSIAVLDSKEINAFATPGGHIFITRGLLNCTKSEDEIAAVLAHELSHIMLKHSIKAIKTSRAINAIVKTGGSVVVAATAGKDSSVEMVNAFSDGVDDIVNSLLDKGFSQSQEFEADAKALDLMNLAGYNPKAMVSLLESLKDKGQNTSGWGKTHPSPTLRIASVSVKLPLYEDKKIAESRTKRFEECKKVF